MTDFSARSERPELMDDPAVAPAELRVTLKELALVNRFLGGYAASVHAVSSLWPAQCRELTLLDVGAGGGDTARRIADWAKNRGLKARIEGIDLAETCVQYSREQSRSYPDIRFSLKNIWDIPSEERYDIVHAALVLHHFPASETARALRRMHELSRLGVVINDLHRHPLAYYSIKVLTAGLSGNRLIRNDAPLSVLRAFRRSCLEQLVRDAGLPAPEIRWRWPFRWQMIIRK